MEFTKGLVSVIIIDFNSGRYLERCLAALESQTYRNLEIVIIDNGSQDGSTALLREWACSGRIRLFEGPNLGFSKANNLGIRETRGEFVLALNADAFLDEDYVRQCISAISSSAEIGAATGKLLSDSNPSKIDSAGHYFYREGLPVDRGFGESDEGQFDRVEFVDGACGAAAVYRRAMLEQIRVGNEFYNESFFAFVEDVELSFRASLAGWRTVYVPTAVAYHVRGGSIQSTSQFAFYLNERNLRVFLHTWYNPTASMSDRVLQWLTLRVRGFRTRHLLAPDYRSKLKREVREMIGRVDSPPTSTSLRAKAQLFCGASRKSFLGDMIRRRLAKGIRPKAAR